MISPWTKWQPLIIEAVEFRLDNKRTAKEGHNGNQPSILQLAVQRCCHSGRCNAVNGLRLDMGCLA